MITIDFFVIFQKDFNIKRCKKMSIKFILDAVKKLIAEPQAQPKNTIFIIGNNNTIKMCNTVIFLFFKNINIIIKTFVIFIY